MCSAASAKPIVSIMALRYALRSVASQARSNCVELRRLVVMSNAAIAVTTNAFAIIVVGIAIAQSASRWLAPNGWMIVDPSFSTPSISM